MHLMRSLATLFLLVSTAMAGGPPHYRQVGKFTLGGEGGWDYLTLDPGADRLFIAHNKEFLVVDAKSGKQLGSIPADGAHGVALVPEKNLGFSTNGRAGTVTVFDAKALKPIRDIKAGENPDAIIYDPHSRRVIVMNGRSKDVMVIDPRSLTVTNTVPLGGKLEFAVTDKGHVYVNVEDTNEIVDLDSKSWSVLHRWKPAGCEEPTGIAIDPRSKHLFATCHKQMIVWDAASGTSVTNLPTGESTDAAAFDPGTGFVFASNGEGTITVIGKDKAGKYAVLETAATQRGARTMALDPKTHRIYTITAELGPPAAGERRPSIKPGTFTLLVFGPEK